MAQTNTEFELKLAGPAGEVAAVPGYECLAAVKLGAVEWERLASTYYDSADERLRAAGVSLRIREDAAGKRLTAKRTTDCAGAIMRLETERLLAEDDTSFSTGVEEIDAIVGEQPQDLMPVARTVTDRWSAIVTRKGAKIEVSAEIGRAERLGDPSRATPLAEVELELVKGSPVGLFALASDLIRESRGRLRLSIETKLDRARRGGAIQLPGKPQALLIPDNATAADLLGLALRPIVFRIIEASAIAAEAHDSEAARGLRVALRRFRSIERVFRKACGKSELKALAKAAREFARLVGAARDLDVFVESGLALKGGASELMRAADARRAQAWHDADLALDGPEFGVFCVGLLRVTLTEHWRAEPAPILSAPARQFADEALERCWERLCGAGASADFSAPESLHPLRIALKKFRYAAQPFRDLYAGARRKAFFSAMSELQNELGAINDAVVAQQIAEALGAGAGAAAARGAGFIVGYRAAEAAIKARVAEEIWRSFLLQERFWR